MRILIIGKGQFGKALNHILSEKHETTMVGRIPSSDTLKTSGSITIICVPTQNLPNLIKSHGVLLSRSSAIISTCKGLINRPMILPHKILTKTFKKVPVFSLSGPSFAHDILLNHPTALVLAGKNKAFLQKLVKTLSCEKMRLYKSSDPLGVELAGALKNVYAIGAGFASGLKLGDSPKAAYITRALSEMARIGTTLGGELTSFFGLAGAGDLILTCTTPKSRNFRFGVGLAQNKSKKTLLTRLHTVEGLWTAKAAHKLCRQNKIRTPLLDMILRIIHNPQSKESVLRQLMLRETRNEFDQ